MRGVVLGEDTLAGSEVPGYYANGGIHFTFPSKEERTHPATHSQNSTSSKNVEHFKR